MVHSLCLLGARAAGVEPVETLNADFPDAEGLRASSLAAPAEAFTGRIAIQPDQVPPINEAFMPSPIAVAHAQRVVDACASLVASFGRCTTSNAVRGRRGQLPRRHPRHAGPAPVAESTS